MTGPTWNIAGTLRYRLKRAWLRLIPRRRPDEPLWIRCLYVHMSEAAWKGRH